MSSNTTFSTRRQSVRTRPTGGPSARREVLRPAGRAGQPQPPLPFVEPTERFDVAEPGWLHEPVAVIGRRHPGDRVSVIEPIRPVEPAPKRRGDGREMRLTRRGQIVLVVTALTAVLGVGVMTGGSATTPAWSATTTQVHVVQPGETLWGVALAAGHDAPTRDVVDRIEDLNGLDSAMLQPGQELQVPVAG